MLLQPRVKTVGSIGEFMGGNYEVKKQLRQMNKKLRKHNLKATLSTLSGSMAIGITTLAKSAKAHTIEAAANVQAIPANANVSNMISEKIQQQIYQAFEPFIGLIQGLSYPISFIMITAGCIFIQIGNKEKGLSMITYGSLGYILVQLAPLFMKILIGVGNVA